MKEHDLDGKKEFLVQWEGSFQPTWQPYGTIVTDCAKAVAEFHKVSHVFAQVNSIIICTQ